MDSLWTTSLRMQFGAAIKMLDNAVVACPDPLWQERLWDDPPPPEFPRQFAEFWYVAFHTIVWLDLYLSGAPEEEFSPPAPFAQGVLDSVEAAPAQLYTREALRAYLVSVRRKCRATIAALTDEQARRPVEYPWSDGQPISFLELQLYSMRHVQGHAAELSVFLGQHGVQTLDWTTRAGPSRR
jgi:hypothetical protein